MNFCQAPVPKMDSIAFTETSQVNNEYFKSKVDIKACKLFHAIKFQGGTAIDVNEKFNVIERKNLNIQKDDYKSVWVEIKNKLSKKI